jgi:hypothetical protein
MIVYPNEYYDSWISEDLADEYFENRLNADSWYAAANKEAALMTAFRSLQELDFNLEFGENGTLADTFYTDNQKVEILTALQHAQCEQALHEVRNDLDAGGVEAVSLGGVLSFKLNESGKQSERFSYRAMAILRPNLRANVITRMR